MSINFFLLVSILESEQSWTFQIKKSTNKVLRFFANQQVVFRSENLSSNDPDSQHHTTYTREIKGFTVEFIK